MERDYTLDIVRCFANYMVVILHAWAAFQYVDNTTIEFASWTFVCSHLCWMAIPTFFLISGYLLFSRFSFSKWPEKMWRRVKRLAVPYVLWNIVFVLFYLAMARMVPRLATRVASFGLDTWSGALSKVVSLTVAPIDGPLWFLRALILMSTLSPIMFLVMRLGKGIIALVLCFAWFFVESYFGLMAKLGLTAPAYAIFCFVLGGVIAMNGKDITRLFRSWLWVVVGLAACVARWFLGWTLVGNLLIPLEAPALLSLVSHLPTVKIGGNAIYRYFKDMSFFAYAGHFLFCSVFLHTLAPLLSFMTTGKFTVLIMVFVVFGVSTMAIIYSVGKRSFQKLMSFFDGTL